MHHRTSKGAERCVHCSRRFKAHQAEILSFADKGSWSSLALSDFFVLTFSLCQDGSLHTVRWDGCTAHMGNISLLLIPQVIFPYFRSLHRLHMEWSVSASCLLLVLESPEKGSREHSLGDTVNIARGIGWCNQYPWDKPMMVFNARSIYPPSQYGVLAVLPSDLGDGKRAPVPKCHQECIWPRVT